MKEFKVSELLLRFFQNEQTQQSESPYPHLFLLLERFKSNGQQNCLIEMTSSDIKIEFAEPDKRMREVVRRSNYRMTGKCPSSKNGRMMHWESHYELATFRLLEIYHSVKSYAEQPAIIRYNDADGVTHLHYPDILVVLNCGTKLFIEVKPKNAEADLNLAKRTSYLESKLKPLGYHYLLLLPEQVESLAYLDNAIHLLQHCRPKLPETVVEEVRRFFLKNNSFTIGRLVQLLEHQYARSWIYKMLISGVLSCDLSVPISPQSLVSWSKKGTA